MSTKPIYARAVAEALLKHFLECKVPVYWVTEKGPSVAAQALAGPSNPLLTSTSGMRATDLWCV